MTKGKLCAVAAATFLLLSGWETARAEDATWTITVNRAMWNKFGFQYPVTYIFHLADMPEDLKVERRDAGGAAWTPLAKKTPADFFGGVECVRLDHKKNTAYVSVGFRTTNTIQLRFAGGGAASSRRGQVLRQPPGGLHPRERQLGLQSLGQAGRGLAWPHERRVGPLPGVAYGLPQLPPAGQHGHQQPHGRRRGRVEEHAAGIGPRRL